MKANVINEQILAYKQIVTNPTTKPKLKRLYKLLDVTPNPMQEELIRLWDTEYKNYFGFGLFCGRGSGKSVAAGNLATLDLLTPGASVILVSPSTAQLKIIWDMVVKNIKRLNIPIEKLDNNKKEMVLGNQSEFAAFSEVNIEHAEGRKASLIIIDEGGLLKRLGQIIDSLTPALGRYGTYDNGMQIGKLCLIGTPKANNKEYYKYYLKGLEKNSGWISLSFPSRVNPINTPEFLEAQKQVLDEKVYLQEYEAQWVLVTESLVFNSFDKQKNTFSMENFIIFDENSMFVAGLDIGASDATAYVLVYVENGKYYVIDAFEQSNLDEALIAEKIKNLERKYNIKNLLRFIDPSAKLTSIGLANSHGIITYPAFNNIQESVSLLNQMFRQEKLYINKDLYFLVEQLMTMEWKENITGRSSDPFKRVKGHHYDSIAALRYAIFTHYKQVSDTQIVII